jgi:hypothetical protein
MQLKSGARLRSQVDATEVIIVRPVPGDVGLTCGGHPMVDLKADVTPGLSVKPDEAAGTALGKRYTLPDDSPLEILVTKPGDGSLAVDGTPLVLKEARPLPASD